MKKLYTLLLGILVGSSISAQDNGTYTLTAGVSQPVGIFAADDYMGNALVSPLDPRGEKGGAVTGLNLGVKRSVSLSDNLDWFLSVELYYNRLNRALDDQIGDHYTTGIYSGYTQVRVNKPAYYNIPVMFGLTYNCPVNSNCLDNLFAEAAIGANLREIAPFVVDYELYYGVEGSYRSHFDAAVRPAAQLGMGVRFASHYSLGAFFSYLGSARMREIQTESLGGLSANYDYRSGVLNTALLSVKLGYTF